MSDRKLFFFVRKLCFVPELADLIGRGEFYPRRTEINASEMVYNIWIVISSLSARSGSADRTRACCNHTESVCVWSLLVQLGGGLNNHKI